MSHCLELIYYKIILNVVLKCVDVYIYTTVRILSSLEILRHLQENSVIIKHITAFFVGRHMLSIVATANIFKLQNIGFCNCEEHVSAQSNCQYNNTFS